jgi:hypothetical protein
VSPTTTPDAQTIALVNVQAQARETFTAQAVAIAAEAARTFTGWYDATRIAEWAAKLAARIEALQRIQAQSTDAYLARAASRMVGGRVSPVGRIDVSSLRAGITHAGTYARAADVYRWQQSRVDRVAADLARADVAGATALLDGNPIAPPMLVDPIDAAMKRVRDVAAMDIQLADRDQSKQFLTENADRRDIRGWRRVIHPELSKGGSCGLCIAISNRIYHVEELREVHDDCQCTTLPIIGTQDPGDSLNNLDLRTLYGDAGGTTSGVALKRTRYQVNENGELGLVLAVHGEKQRTPRQATQDENRPRKAKSPAEKRATLERMHNSLADALPKARELAAADPKRWSPYLGKLEARVADLQSQLAA